jgi:transketolase
VFDDDFTGTVLADHQQMIAATQAEVSHGSSPAVVRLARQTLPVLRRHLKLLQAAAGSG